MPLKSSRLLRSARESIGTAADLLTLIPIMIAAAIALWGWFVNQPALGAAIALGLSLIANLALAVTAARLRRKTAELAAVADGLRATVAATVKATPRKLNRWIGNSGDLATLKLTNSDLENSYECAQLLAGGRLGPDAEVRFFALRLGRDWATGYPEVHLEAHSATAGRDALIVSTGTAEGCEVNSISRRKSGSFLSDNPAPWRTDQSWTQLVAFSWLRMKPFVGDVSMLWAQDRWRIDYERRVDDEALPLESFSLDASGTLVEA